MSQYTWFATSRHNLNDTTIMINVLVGLGIIHLVTPCVILFSGNSKSIGNWKQKFIIKVLELLCYMHSSLIGFPEFLIYKCLSSDNLSLDLHDVSIFWLESDTSDTLASSFAQTCLKLRDHHWRFKYFRAELSFEAAIFL